MPPKIEAEDCLDAMCKTGRGGKHRLATALDERENRIHPPKIYTKVDLYTQLDRSRSPNNVKHSSSNYNLLQNRCGLGRTGRLASRSHAFSIRDIATRTGEGLVHCLQATSSPLQEFRHSRSDCRILPRDVIPPTLLGAASSSAWFGLTFWLPTAQSKRLGLSRY